jgi:hypothetical protein
MSEHEAADTSVGSKNLATLGMPFVFLPLHDWRETGARNFDRSQRQKFSLRHLEASQPGEFEAVIMNKT